MIRGSIKKILSLLFFVCLIQEGAAGIQVGGAAAIQDLEWVAATGNTSWSQGLAWDWHWPNIARAAWSENGSSTTRTTYSTTRFNAAYYPDFSLQTTITYGLSNGGLIFDSSLGITAMNITFSQRQAIGPAGGGTLIQNRNTGSTQSITFVSDMLSGGVTASGTSADTLLTFNGGAQVEFNGGEQGPNVWFSAGSPDINAALNVQNYTDILLFQNEGTTNDTVALRGPLTGAGIIRASNTGAGTLNLALSNTSGNTLTGFMEADSGTTITPMVSDSFPSDAALTLSGGSLDLTKITPSASAAIATKRATISSSSTIKIVIDAASNYSTFINLADNAITAEAGFTLNVEVQNGPLTTDKTYTLFENAGEGSRVELAALTGITGVTSSIILEGATYSLWLSPYIPPSASFTASAPQIRSAGASKNFTTALTSTSVTGISGTMMAGSRADVSGGTGDDYSNRSFSFARNPFQAPNVNTETLSLTEGGLRSSVQETREKFRPLKLGKTSFWAQPFGSVLSQGTLNGQNGFKARTGGILFGGDHKLNPEVIVGGGIGYARTRLTQDSNQGKLNIGDKFATVFGTYFKEHFYVEGALVLGLQRYSGYRNIVSTNLSASGRHNGHQITPHLGGGYNFRTHEPYPIQVFAAFDYVYAHQQGYTETGAGTQNVTYQGSNSTMLRSEIGGKIDRTFDHDNSTSKVTGKLSVVNKKPFQKGTIITANAGTFEPTIKTENYLSPGLEAKHEWEDGMSLGFAYSGEFGTKYVANELSVTVKKRL